MPYKQYFSYDLAVNVIPSTTQSNELTICCHGYGDSHRIVDVINSYKVLQGHLVGFNFPDYGITSAVDHTKSKFGTIDEILPLLYLIKYYICDVNIPRVHLYGFSAGGGAIINALVILNTYQYKEQLERIGITQEVAQQMINVLEQGHIILDCPLKSIEEIIAFRGVSRELEILAFRYAANNMNPIDVLPSLVGLNLTIFLHFQQGDEVLSNRDDALFIKQLQQANKGITFVTIGQGNHNAYHTELWHCYSNFLTKSSIFPVPPL